MVGGRLGLDELCQHRRQPRREAGPSRALLRRGATIHEINAVRKTSLGDQGGRLALACSPARVHSFVISDVAGDDLSVIASGPTVPDASTSQDALAILQRYHVPYSATLQAHGISCQRNTEAVST